MTDWPPTDAVRGSVVHAYWAGDSIQKIMADLNLPDHYVRAILYEAGGRIPRTRVTDETLAQIHRLAEDGASHTEIKRTTGADYRTVFMVAPGTAWARGGGGDAGQHRALKDRFDSLDGPWSHTSMQRGHDAPERHARLNAERSRQDV